MQSPFEQLETEGYAVFPGFLDRGTARRIREHMDSLLPPVAPRDDATVPRVNTLRHPIPGAIMAEILANPRLLELAGELLRAQHLRLLEQVLIRTDPGPAAAGAGGWHIDMAFLPAQYRAVPRQTYYHMVHSLNDVPRNGGAFMIVPGSHLATYAAAERLGSLEALAPLKADPINVAGIELAGAIEVTPAEGDLLVFNPMALHSASNNVSDCSRYVYFASFMDASADYLQGQVRADRHWKGFPDSLREGLPAELSDLLWT
jgi:ectoine hydroxylase-related dioxygenase (phytanoyl-CoA dioxygenase family)